MREVLSLLSDSLADFNDTVFPFCPDAATETKKRRILGMLFKRIFLFRIFMTRNNKLLLPDVLQNQFFYAMNYTSTKMTTN